MEAAARLIATLPVEQGLLLLIASVCDDDELEKRMRPLAQRRVDWLALTRAAARHGLVPLMCRRLWLVGSSVPESVLTQTRAMYLSRAATSLHLARQLRSHTRDLSAQEIRVLAFKGPDLAVRAYADVTLREYDDLDLLVDRADIARAAHAFVRRGFRAVVAPREPHLRRYLRAHHDYELVGNDGTVVELQWAVSQRRFPSRVDFDGLWARRVQTKVLDGNVPALGREDLLLLLCMHGSKHRWQRLAWVADVAHTVRSTSPLDWRWLRHEAKAYGAERMLLLGLLLAKDLLGLSLPADVCRAAVGCSPVNCTSADVTSALLLPARPKSLRDEDLFFFLRLRERLSDRVSLALRYLPRYLRRLAVRVSRLGRPRHGVDGR